MDKIFIRDLALRAIIGTIPEERRERQDIIINLEISADLQAAGHSDNLLDTIDYKSLKKQIIAMVEESRFQLLERLAEEIAGICLAVPMTQAVRVTIDKPGALRFAKSAAVEIYRQH